MQEVLKVARRLAAADRIEQVLRWSAETACRVLGYTTCTASRRGEDGNFRCLALVGGSAELERELRGRVMSGSTFGALIDAATSIGQVYWVPAGHPVRKLPEVQAAIRPTDVSVPGRSWERGSLLLVPMRDGQGQVVGFLNPDDPVSGHVPGTSEALLLGSLAELTAIAMETVEARETARRSLAVAEAQRRQLEELLTASVAVRGHGALDQVLQEIVRAMSTAAGFRRAAVYLLDAEGSAVQVRASVGLDDEADRRLRETAVPLGEFAQLMRPEMRVSRSFLCDHRYHEVPPQLDEKLSIPDVDPDWKEGMWHALDSLTVPLEDAQGELLGLISVDEPLSRRLPTVNDIKAIEMFADQCSVAVAEARRYERAMAEASTDPLTGLPNRRALFPSAAHLIADAERRGLPCTVAFLDIDHFKEVNDRHGHAAGDDVIAAVGRAMVERLRAGDVVARYGGEEFVAVLPGTCLQDAVVTIDEVRRRVATTAIPALGRERVRVSAGLAQALPGEGVTELFARADAALYKAKQAGRDQVQIAA
jgi:diguanylate cyclase (GGDEF)-like protein